MAHPVLFRYLSYSTTFSEHTVHCLLQCTALGPPVYRSSNLVGTLRLIDSIGLRVERPYSPSSQRIPWYFSRSLAHTHADIDSTMPNMCTGAFYVLQRLNNSCAIYAIYTVVCRAGTCLFLSVQLDGQSVSDLPTRWPHDYGLTNVGAMIRKYTKTNCH